MKLKTRFLELLCPFLKQDSDFQTAPPSRERVETRYIIALLILWVIIMLFGVLRCKAQDRPLKIGDKVPDITINNIYNFPSKTARLSDFRGKLLIIDFWATWCSPCVGMIAKTDTLQRELAGRVQFLPVSYQSEKEVLPFLQRLGKGHEYSFPDVLGDTELAKLFPHTYLPHYVWIDASGIVRAITGYAEVNRTTIGQMLSGQKTMLPVKTDNELVDYDPGKPLFFNGNGGDGSTVTYHSIFSRYVKGLPAGYTIEKSDTSKGIVITARNSSILMLLQAAYMNVAYFNLNRMSIEVKDTLRLNCHCKGEAAEQWLKNNNGFCYELQVPHSMRNNVFQMMQADLAMLFPEFEVRVEKRKRECLVLLRTSKVDKLKSAGGDSEYHFDGTRGIIHNASLKMLYGELNVLYLHHLSTPLIDETGYTGNVDLEIEANMQNVDQLNDALAAYDLKLEKAERNIDVLVISDKKN